MIGRKPIISADSPEQGESIQRNYVIFDVSAQEGSPTLKRSGKGGELTDWRRYGAPFALWLLAQKILLGRIWRGGELPNRRPSIRPLADCGRGSCPRSAALLHDDLDLPEPDGLRRGHRCIDRCIHSVSPALPFDGLATLRALPKQLQVIASRHRRPRYDSPHQDARIKECFCLR